MLPDCSLTAFSSVVYTERRPPQRGAVKEGAMCEINAFVLKDGKEELYLENVNIAKSAEGKVFLKNLFGEQKEFEGSIKEVSLAKNRLILVTKE